MTRSENQIQQLYVADTFIDGTDADKVAEADIKSIQLVINKKTMDFYFRHKGAGGVTRTDIIPFKHLMGVKATSADDMAYVQKAVKVTLNENINDGELVTGQDYILNIAFKDYIAHSDEHQYFKFGAVKAFPNMKVATFYLRMAQSLAYNFSREVTPLVKIGLVKGSDYTWVTHLTNFKEMITDGQATDDWEGIIIEEAQQPWERGTFEFRGVDFTVHPGTIFYQGEWIWGVVEKVETGDTINNGMKIADLEYFCMGNRGDIYRNVGWPNSIPTKYLVNPTEAYHTLDLHYCYIGDNESIQKSEKDLTIVSPDKEVINSIVNCLNEVLTENPITTLVVKVTKAADETPETDETLEADETPETDETLEADETPENGQV